MYHIHVHAIGQSQLYGWLRINGLGKYILPAERHGGGEWRTSKCKQSMSKISAIIVLYKAGLIWI